jgi:hypothetical protein
VEKLIYPLWSPPRVDGDAFREQLLAQLLPGLAQLSCVRSARLAVADGAVAAAAGRRMDSHPPVPAAMLSLWVDYAVEASWEPLLDSLVARRSGYLVTEAEPLQSERRHPVGPGERVHGWCQVAWLRKPAHLHRQDWLAIWQCSHTRVAIETQATFGYRQNRVVQALTADSAPFDAIVEEHFPPEAMAMCRVMYAYGTFTKDPIDFEGRKVSADKFLRHYLTTVPEGNQTRVWGYSVQVEVCGTAPGMLPTQ